MSDIQSNTWAIHLSRGAPLQWGAIYHGRPHECPTCKIPLLTGEYPGFCCGPNGKCFADVPPLSPLPPEFAPFINDPNISYRSRKLNLLFALAAVETTLPFFKFRGPQGFFSIQGRVFHRLRAEHEDSPVHWIVYDGFALDCPPHAKHARKIPAQWIERVRDALLRCNPFVRCLRILGDLDPQTCPYAHVVLSDTGAPSPEVAALLRYDNTVGADVQPR
ncbi:hypothetical protein LXA43DRAFT_890182, partial [Ganoderma leucocontextum]